MEEVDLEEEEEEVRRKEDTPDPRIQVELERLNTATDTINKLEVDLDEARMVFRQLLTDSTQRIDTLAKRLGKCVEQSRPYYEARIQAKQTLRDTQAAASRYERASTQHAVAREMVFLAEEGLMEKGCSFDDTWQEMFNHATFKVNEAEKDRMESAVEHRRTSALYHEAETRVKALQKELKRAIGKSSLNARRSLLQMNNLARMHQLQLLPYFELKSAVNQQLEAQKQQVRKLEESVGRAKKTYSQALANLETISDEIHRNRQSHDLGVRGIGVGADSPVPPIDSIEAGLTITHPLHYDTIPPTDTSQEYMSLPGKLGPVAAPILAAQPTRSTTTTATATTITPVSSTSSLPADPDGCERKVEKGRERKGSELSGDMVVEEVDGGTSTDLSGWQVIGLGTPPLAPSQNYLTVDDRDSTVSDTESLASIEMLSDEAIAGLMLDEEIAQASSIMYTATAATSSTAADTPIPGSSSIHFLPSFFHNNGGDDTKETKSLTRSTSEDCNSLTQSFVGLKMNPSAAHTRPHPPPDTLTLTRESSSDHSSPEDLTPGYARLRDTPISPDDFPPSQESPSTSTGEDGPHCSSWVMESSPAIKK